MVSVIVPVYKVEPYLKNCVDSIINQTYNDLEIILVDDGSPDNSGTMCDIYAQADRRIKVIHKKNGGLASARNAGLQLARGEYIAFIDSDDSVDLSMYEFMVRIAEEKQADLVICGCQKISASDQIEKCDVSNSRSDILDADGVWKELFIMLNNSSCNKLYKRTLLDGICFPEELVHGEDMIFNLHYALRCTNGVRTTCGFYHYYDRAGSITRAAFSKRNFKEINVKDEAKRIVEEYKPSDTIVAECYCFRARMNVIREMIRSKREKEYHEELLEMKNYVRKEFARVYCLLKFKEKVEVGIMLSNANSFYRMLLILIS